MSLGLIIASFLWGAMAAFHEFKHDPSNLQEFIISALLLIAYQLRKLREKS